MTLDLILSGAELELIQVDVGEIAELEGREECIQWGFGMS